MSDETKPSNEVDTTGSVRVDAGVGREIFKVEYRLTLDFQATTLDGIRARLPKDAQIISINDREFVAYCEACGKPICEGDGWHNSVDDIYICLPCCDEVIPC